jgi:NAD(P)-dependent dehydrogenase (short-subunit alcohol dehydrogenase family)
MRPVSFKGRVAVVTGAGRGLGLAFVELLARRGADCVIAELDAALGDAAAARLQAEGLAVSCETVDVSRPDSVEALADAVVQRHGRIDIWINNAGLAEHGPSERLSAQSWQRGTGVMLSGTFYGCQAAGRVMIEQGSGAIINVTSINGFVAQPGRAAYCAAKAGVVRLTEVLAAEWAEHGVRVNAIAPGVILTELSRRAIESGAASVTSYVDRTPAGRLGEVAELDNALLYLASDLSAYVTGQTLRIDGGWVSDHYL